MRDERNLHETSACAPAVFSFSFSFSLALVYTLINTNASEPCIRGHRSTKCNHASERVMLPVRKPGRPLSICPHPPNNGCSCATVTAALPRSRKCGCGSKSAGGAAGVNGANGNGSASSSSKTPRSPSKRAFFKPPTSPKSLARSRIDPSALDRTDVSQMNIHAPPPGTSGWPSNGHPPSSIDDLSLAGSGHPNGGAFMLPGESMAFFGGQGEPSAMFPHPGAPGAYAQHGYPIQDPGSEHMYANGGHDDFNAFFGNGMGMSAPLGEMHLGGGNENSGLDGFGLDLNPRTSQMNGFHGLQFQTSHAPPPPPQEPSAATTKGSCCAPATQPQHLATESARHTPTSSTNSLASNGGSGSGTTANTKSCCSGSPVSASSSSSQKQQQQQHTMLKSESSVGGRPGSVSLSSIPRASTSGSTGGSGDVKPPMANGHVDQYAAAAALQQQHGVTLVGQQVYPGFAQQGQQHQQHQHQAHGAPAWYRYPPEYGTVTAPLQPSQWRSSLTVTAGPDASMFNAMQQGHQSYDAATIQQHQQHQQPQHPFEVHNGNLVDGDDMHMCSCGDGCECVGCVAHPYNNATRDTVRSVWSMMDDSSSTSSTRTATVTTTLPAQTTVDSTSPSQQVFTPSASDTSGVSDDQVSLPAGDFLFVSYSVMGCDGEGLTCPCGDDCQCVGCTIHNNTL